MDTDYDLPELIQRQDHLNILRYCRIHQLRESALVVYHGQALLGGGPELKGATTINSIYHNWFGGGSSPYINPMIQWAVLEQIAYAALDCANPVLAETCLSRLREVGVDNNSVRFRLLLARCLEQSTVKIEEYNKEDNNSETMKSSALIIYDDLLKENPSNSLALKRKYCLLKAVPGKEVEAITALNTYLQQNYSDTAAWYELGQMHQEIGDWKSAAYCLEEVLLATPASAKIHCELAECYATTAATGVTNTSTVGTGDGRNDSVSMLRTSRQHMAQALELDPMYIRAQYGLMSVSNAYVQMINNTKSKSLALDDFELQVANELIQYGMEQLLHSYKGTESLTIVKTFMDSME